MTKTTEHLLQTAIIVAIGLMITCGVFVGLFALNRMKGNNRLIQSEVEYNQALKDNVGGEQVIRHIYE